MLQDLSLYEFEKGKLYEKKECMYQNGWKVVLDKGFIS